MDEKRLRLIEEIVSDASRYREISGIPARTGALILVEEIRRLRDQGPRTGTSLGEEQHTGEGAQGQPEDRPPLPPE
jgi:hypothetical protein